MSNFYTDNPDLAATLRRLDLRRVVRLREDGYAQARDFAYAPADYEDALDSYERTLRSPATSPASSSSRAPKTSTARAAS